MAFPLTGIENANEFYSQHYLDEVLEQDLKELFAAWQAQGAASPWWHPGRSARLQLGPKVVVAEFGEIKENDFNLNIPRYVDTFKEEEEIDVDAVQAEIDELEEELEEVRLKMAEKLREIQR